MIKAIVNGYYLARRDILQRINYYFKWAYVRAFHDCVKRGIGSSYSVFRSDKLI